MNSINIRPARLADAGDIAKLFMISSDGLAEYIWRQFGGDGRNLIEIGTSRYERENTFFSYQNCWVAERNGVTAGMLHGFVIPEGDDEDEEEQDPVLKPYSELEEPGSFYISGVALFPQNRGRGMGSRLLEEAERQAKRAGAGSLSLICFEKNSGAMRLYKSLGYRDKDRRALVPHPCLHYQEGDAVLMVKSLA